MVEKNERSPKRQKTSAKPDPAALIEQQSNGLGLPEQLQLLPLYTMALQKNKCFRGGTEIGTGR